MGSSEGGDSTMSTAVVRTISVRRLLGRARAETERGLFDFPRSQRLGARVRHDAA